MEREADKSKGFYPTCAAYWSGPVRRVRWGFPFIECPAYGGLRRRFAERSSLSWYCLPCEGGSLQPHHKLRQLSYYSVEIDRQLRIVGTFRFIVCSALRCVSEMAVVTQVQITVVYVDGVMIYNRTCNPQTLVFSASLDLACLHWLLSFKLGLEGVKDAR